MVNAAADAKTAIKTVIFDFGRVLTLDRDPRCAAAIAELFGLDPEPVDAAYVAERDPYDSGEIGAEEYWSRVARRLGRPAPSTDILVRLDQDSWFRLNHDTIALARRIKATGRRLMILSNMNFEGKDRLLGKARFHEGKDWLAEFDDTLLSCDLGLVKPQAAIYEVCAGRAAAPAEACLFIDDNAANVAAARNFGMRAELFRDAGELADILRRDYDVLEPVSRSVQ